ncbi:MAG: sulfotransferase domain-containing protein [Candidatus Kerfeldbacteria bacterium]|nr:sulfotransferase domain-containing protein [Candidatus Kerfeldbacteria bacterium]
MITIVSGLPRSGTSMMMKMLEAGGLPALVDQVRTADIDNPKGYYEFERVKQLPGDTAWLPEAEGKAVKMVSMLLYELPKDRPYQVVFMRRAMPEILASQKKMLLRRDANMVVDDVEMKQLFEGHLKNITAWLSEQSHLKVIEVWYNDMLKQPAAEAKRLNAFFGGTLNEAAMSAIVDESLYRNRA